MWGFLCLVIFKYIYIEVSRAKLIGARTRLIVAIQREYKGLMSHSIKL